MKSRENNNRIEEGNNRKVTDLAAQHNVAKYKNSTFMKKK